MAVDVITEHNNNGNHVTEKVPLSSTTCTCSLGDTNRLSPTCMLMCVYAQRDIVVPACIHSFLFLIYFQFTRYLHMYDPDAGVKVIPCHRYSTETCGAKIIVTKEW